ncbi:unnamed protein product, partial [Prunus brigantina]
MAGGSDSLKERVPRIDNFLGTMSGDEAESMVAHMEDLNAKTAEIEKILGELKTSMMKKVTDDLGDMDGLAEAIGGKLKEVETELSVVKLTVSGSASSHEGSMTTKIKVPRPKAYVGERSSKELENFLWDMEPAIEEWALSELRRQDVRSLNSAIAAAERLMDYRAAVTSSGKKEQGGKKHLDTKGANKGKESKVIQDGAKSG